MGGQPTRRGDRADHTAGVVEFTGQPVPLDEGPVRRSVAASRSCAAVSSVTSRARVSLSRRNPWYTTVMTVATPAPRIGPITAAVSS
jgi:hypothetical protein